MHKMCALVGDPSTQATADSSAVVEPRSSQRWVRKAPECPPVEPKGPSRLQAAVGGCPDVFSRAGSRKYSLPSIGGDGLPQIASPAGQRAITSPSAAERRSISMPSIEQELPALRQLAEMEQQLLEPRSASKFDRLALAQVNAGAVEEPPCQQEQETLSPRPAWSDEAEEADSGGWLRQVSALEAADLEQQHYEQEECFPEEPLSPESPTSQSQERPLCAEDLGGWNRQVSVPAGPEDFTDCYELHEEWHPPTSDQQGVQGPYDHLGMQEDDAEELGAWNRQTSVLPGPEDVILPESVDKQQQEQLSHNVSTSPQEASMNLDDTVPRAPMAPLKPVGNRVLVQQRGSVGNRKVALVDLSQRAGDAMGDTDGLWTPPPKLNPFVADSTKLRQGMKHSCLRGAPLPQGRYGQYATNQWLSMEGARLRAEAQLTSGRSPASAWFQNGGPEVLGPPVLNLGVRCHAFGA
eukprot:TRINITY_DN37970_c0_g1_i1.p1 TRINITY_DN37970_c0_g1~~TRINITY_DN37970_c0_g1_i1.p1  ORF type:complete len:465 (-),score=90.89 TRINITY_DN37970_c0_g1_i1:37-1431(-)